MDKKIPLIIDCDPGGDDAFAIMMVHGSGKYDIRAICPVNGNSPLRATKTNSMDLNCYLGINTRVCIGADKPLIQGISIGDNIADIKAEAKKNGENEEEIGSKFLSHMTFPAPTMDYDTTPAWDVIYQEAKKFPGELVILALGPLTNLAIAFAKYHDLKDLVKEIVCMGGTTDVGNANSYAEFNTFIDPYAWQAVIKTGVPFVMLGLNVTHQGYLTVEEMEELAKMPTRIPPMMDAFYQQTLERQEKIGKFGQTPFTQMPWRRKGIMSYPDAAAAAYLIDPTMFHTEYKEVRVECRSPIAFGQTIVDLRDGDRGAVPNCYVCLTCDREKYKDLIFDCVAAYK